MAEQILNNNAKKIDFLESICYAATFILILLSVAYINELLFFYSFEMFYILITWLKAVKDNIKIGRYTLWSLVFFSVCLFSYIYAIDQSVAFKQIFNLLKTLLVCNSILFFINSDENKLSFILKTIVISSLYLALLLIVNTPYYEWGSERLGESIGFNSNDLGLKMSISSIISVYFGKTERKQYYFLTIIFSFIAFFSGSRKAFMFIVICIVSLNILTIKKKKSLIIVIPLLMSLIYIVWTLIMNIPYFYNVLGNRLELMINGILGHSNVDNSTLIRLYMIDYGIQLFKHKPFLGYGLFNYSVLTTYAYSHNNYIELLVGVGILGTAIYYSMYVNIIYKLSKSIRKNKYSGLFISLIIGLAIMEYGLVSYYEEIFQILIVCGYSAIAIKLNKV